MGIILGILIADGILVIENNARIMKIFHIRSYVLCRKSNSYIYCISYLQCVRCYIQLKLLQPTIPN